MVAGKIVEAFIGLLQARARMRVRYLAKIFLKPAMLLVVLVVVFSVIMVLRGDGMLDKTGTDWFVPWVTPLTSGYVCCLGVVAVTGQRGSPLRWSRSDVAWVLQSGYGPYILVLEQCIVTVGRVLLGWLVMGPVFSLVYSRPVVWVLVTGVCVASLVFLLRTASIFFHYLGCHGRHVKQVVVGLGAAVIVVSLLSVVPQGGVSGFFLWRSAIIGPLGQVFMGVFRPWEANWQLALILLAACSGVTWWMVAKNSVLIEPAVRGSILSQQLADALSGRRPDGFQRAQAYQRGLSSWRAWARTPSGAVFVSGLAQERRRYKQLIGACCLNLFIVLALTFLAGEFSFPWTAVIIGSVVALQAPAQVPAYELSHQHVWLSSCPRIKALMAGSASAFLTTLLPVAPALVLGAVIHRLPVTHTIFLVVMVIVFLAMSLWVGIASWVFSTSPAVRAAVSLLLSAIPAGSASVALLAYGTSTSPGIAAITFTGTFSVAALIYAGAAAALYLNPPGNPGRIFPEKTSVTHRR